MIIIVGCAAVIVGLVLGFVVCRVQTRGEMRAIQCELSAHEFANKTLEEDIRIYRCDAEACRGELAVVREERNELQLRCENYNKLIQKLYDDLDWKKGHPEGEEKDRQRGVPCEHCLLQGRQVARQREP